MEASFSSLPTSFVHRVIAYTSNRAMQLWEKGQLVFHPSISIRSASPGSQQWKDHLNDVYDQKEVACFLSHLTAIREAYEAGHELALILEDDALITSRFHRNWFHYVGLAPEDWKILQLATSNPQVGRHGAHLLDPFISWQPYHWCARAYLINRAGMQTLMDNHYSTNNLNQFTWNMNSFPALVADEAVYLFVGGAYTSTGLWIDSFDYGKVTTVQASDYDVANQGVMLSYLPYIVGDDDSTQDLLKDEPNKLNESILVIMNAQVVDIRDATIAIGWMQQDYQELCQFHEMCVWWVNLWLMDTSMVGTIPRLLFDLPEGIHVETTVSESNNFLFFSKLVHIMPDFDIVLVKDLGHRIAGFPWLTFMAKKGNAVVSGSLKQIKTESTLTKIRFGSQEDVFFHVGLSWAVPSPNIPLSSNPYANIVPIDVPFLGMHFILFDAKFASHFFGSISTDKFSGEFHDWGPEYLLCEAAKLWDNSRPSCFLIPVVSASEVRQHSHKRREFQTREDLVLDHFRKNFNSLELPASWSWVKKNGHLEFSEMWHSLKCGPICCKVPYDAHIASHSKPTPDLSEAFCW